MTEVRRFPIRCDVCVLVPPAWRLDLPPGTVMFAAQEVASGKVSQLQSSGAFGICEECRACLSRMGAARRWAERMLANPQFVHLEGAVRKHALEYMERRYSVIIPLLTNLRAYVAGEDPMDGLMVENPNPGGSAN